MTRHLFTATDIRSPVREQKASVLVMSTDDLITPETADMTRELGVQIVREPGQSPSPTALGELLPLHGVNRAGALLGAFGVDIPKTPEVRLRDVITAEDGSPLAPGYTALDAQTPDGSVFPWTLTYDEIGIALEGELVVTRDGKHVPGAPGDVLFIPTAGPARALNRLSSAVYMQELLFKGGKPGWMLDLPGARTEARR